jgi:hypothetical protein
MAAFAGDGAVFPKSAGFAFTVLGATTKLRTSFPVRGSARTTNVFRPPGTGATAPPIALGAGETSAARLGEAAVITSASKKQIYTVLFRGESMLGLVTIFSWLAQHRDAQGIC